MQCARAASRSRGTYNTPSLRKRAPGLGDEGRVAPERASREDEPFMNVPPAPSDCKENLSGCRPDVGRFAGRPRILLPVAPDSRAPRPLYYPDRPRTFPTRGRPRPGRVA